MLILQLSDLHLKDQGQKAYDQADTTGRLETTLDYIQRENIDPDAVIITGDLSDDGSTDSYERLKLSLKKITSPVYLLPGNHDRKANLTETFPEFNYLKNTIRDEGHEYICYTVEDRRLLLICLDTSTLGQHGGDLGPNRLQWLEQTLASRPDVPTMIAMHHPPFASAIGHMDRSPFKMRDRLAGVIRRNPQVIRLTCGHIHRSITTGFGGTIATVAPGVGMQIPVDLRPAAPSNFILEPPAFLIHFMDDSWGDGGSLSTYTVTVEEKPGLYGGLHPFFGVE